MLFSLISKRILAGALLVYISANPVPIDKSTLEIKNTEILRILEPFTLEEDVDSLQKYVTAKNTYIGGVTYFGSNSICISDLVTKRSEKEKILYHEIGHVINFEPGFKRPYSSTPELLNIFKEEKTKLSYYSEEYYFTEKPDEFFAESYSIYILQRDKLKEHGPLMYEYIDKIAHESDVEEAEELKNKLASESNGTIIRVIN